MHFPSVPGFCIFLFYSYEITLHKEADEADAEADVTHLTSLIS